MCAGDAGTVYGEGMSRLPRRSHYSYTLFADPAVVEQFDQTRFGGEIGHLVALAQERVLDDFAGDLHGASVLDVGTGTGRAALAMARIGGKVTGIDTSQEMLRVARSHAEAEGLEVEFVRGDAHALDFPDEAFDLVVSLRMLMHTPNWRQCLGEMCRVARHRVIFDYPPLFSAPTVQMVLRRLARIAGPLFANTVYAHIPAFPYVVCAVISIVAGLLAVQRLQGAREADPVVTSVKAG